MKSPNQKNNFISAETANGEPYFGSEAAQTAQQVVPLVPQTVYENPSPTVAMRIQKKQFNPLTILSVIAVLVLGVFAAFYTVQNQTPVSAPTEAAVEENNIEPVETTPQVIKTVAASKENLTASEMKIKKRERRAPQSVSNEPILIYDSSMPVEDDNNADESSRPRKEIRDKKLEKHLRKIERLKEDFKPIKEILQDLDDN